MKTANNLLSFVRNAGLLLAIGLGACQVPPAPTRPVQTPPVQTPTVQAPTPSLGASLEFETISLEGNHPARTTSSVKPEVIWIDNQADTEQIEDHISAESYRELINLDFDQYIALAAFRGMQTTCGYDIVIERVETQDGRLVVYALFWEPGPGYGYCEIATYPYHIVKVRRQADLNGELELLLQGTAITPTPHPNYTP